MSKTLLFTTLFLLSAIPAGHAGANLITNGDFEAGSLSGGVNGGFGPFLTMGPGSSAITGWEVGLGGVNLWTDYNGTGNHVIDIIGDSITAGGSLMQTFATVEGQTYGVSFDLSGANNPTPSPQNNPVKQMDITILGSDSSTVLEFVSLEEDTSSWNGAFQQVSFNFVANGSQAQILFEGLNSGFNGFYIDNVEISAVPLPASIYLLGTVLLSLLGIGKRDKPF